MRWVLISLVLVGSLSAVELRWDDDQRGGYLLGINVCDYAVLFHDAVGDYMPGDTGGQEGVIRQFRMMFGDYYPYDGDYLPELYIYSRAEDDDPGEVLSGPLEYNRYNVGDWWHFDLIDPVLVPGEFFAVVHKPWHPPHDENYAIYADETSDDWGVNHSRFRYYGWGPLWRTFQKDIRIRPVWIPTGPAIDEVSWGVIKASSR